MNGYNSDSDITIIGSGAAGLCAALSASMEEVSLTVMSSGEPASKRASGFNGIPYSNDSPTLFYNDIMKSGEYLSDPILAAEVSLFAGNIITFFDKFGINIEEAGTIKVRLSGGSSTPRTIFTDGEHLGDWIIKKMHITAQERGVEFVDCQVFDVVHKDEYFILYGLKEDGGITCHRTKAVIIATGGLGKLYGYTTNYPSSRGIGYMIALRLGASLIDMEFAQFEPFIMLGPGHCRGRGIPINLVADGGKVTNNMGEEFIPPSSLGIRAYTKDVLGRLIANEITEGRGTANGGVLCDLYKAEGIIDKYPGFLKQCSLAGVDPLKSKIEICPAYHCMMGGIMINSYAETGVEGLYAAGEVAGGIHGANRLGSNGITDAFSMGVIAGQSAAKYIMNNKLNSKERNIINSETDCYDFSTQLTDYEDIYKTLSKMMIENVGLVRTEQKLYETANFVKKTINMIEFLSEKSNSCKNLQYLQLMNDLELALIIINTAIRRKETRGVHYRKDFPSLRGQYNGSFTVRKIQGTHNFGFIRRGNDIVWE